ncbi:MAG: PIG-L deacetylase family protein [Candidatus Helarchaeota archaeon]
MNDRIIVFAPHPDDETLGCGGTIAKRISEGYEVLIIIITDGRHSFLKVLGIDTNPTPEELKEIRKEEVKKATRILGVPEQNLIFLDFVDGMLEKNNDKAEEKITEILNKNRPVEVYYPYRKDGHPDHRATNQIVKNSIRKLGIFPVMYQYSIAHKYARVGPKIDDLFNLLKDNMVSVDISKFIPLKKTAVKEFKSELSTISSKHSSPINGSINKYLKNKEKFYIDKLN